MNAWRLLLLAAALAAVGVLVWWAFEPRPLSVPLWEVEAENPLLIGTPEDPFAYTGGDHVQSIAGSARIFQSPDTDAPTLRASIRLPDSLHLPWDAWPAEGADLNLRMGEGDTIERWEDLPIHGSTGVGDPRLPEAHAQLAGLGRLSLSDGIDPRTEGLLVFWSVAQAIRQQDGGIRQQGLTFSPLLREKKGFADPDRWELTLLVYAPSEDGAESASRAPKDSPVLLQIVYRDLIIVPPDSSG